MQLPDFDLEEFLAVHNNPVAPVSIRINEQKTTKQTLELLHNAKSVPWCSTGYYLPERPVFAFDPLWHAGAYYVQEASSMMLEQIWRKFMDDAGPCRILDLCAAPGGKSTHLLALMKSCDLLVANETIAGRIPALLENISRWGSANCIVTQSDAREFGLIENCFDFMLVDAPCSGGGLFRKDPNATAHWSTDAVTACSLRQKRILADVLPALREGGILVYSTCSYATKENEEIVEWIASTFQLEVLPLNFQEEWGWRNYSNNSRDSTGIRAFPHLVEGEGFFLCAFRKPNAGSNHSTSAISKSSKRRQEVVPAGLYDYIEERDDLVWKTVKEKWWCMPKHLYEFYAEIEKIIRVKKAGCYLGELINKKFQPSQDFALNALVSKKAARVELSSIKALQFLRGEAIQEEGVPKGLLLCQYNGLSIGWGKNIGSRINNLLPKEWRLRKSARL